MEVCASRRAGGQAGGPPGLTESGRTAPRQQGVDRLSRRIEAAPDCTLEELRALLLRERGIRVRNGTVWRVCHRHGLTTKKVRSRRRAGPRRRSGGARLPVLPPYSPDVTQIEFAFSKLESLLRAAAARTQDTLWTTVSPLLDAATPAECRKLFTATGYEPD